MNVRVFQSLMIEENAISSKKNKQTNKKRKQTSKNEESTVLGDLEKITVIVTFSKTLGLLVCIKMKESL